MNVSGAGRLLDSGHVVEEMLVAVCILQLKIRMLLSHFLTKAFSSMPMHDIFDWRRLSCCHVRGSYDVFES